MGDGISEIPYGIFEECSSLGYIKFGKGIVSIGDCAFKNCRTLNNVELNETCLRKIGNRSFEDCQNLNNLALPKSLTEIGNRAFRRTGIKVEGLPNSIHIGKTHKSFSELWHDVIYPFDDAGNLTEDAKRLASFGLVYSDYTKFHVGGWFRCWYNPDKRAPDFEVRQTWSSKRIVLSKEDNPSWCHFADTTPIEELEFLPDVKSFDYEIFIKSRWWESDQLKYKKSIGEIEFYPIVVKRFVVPAERLEIAEALRSLYGDRVTIKQSNNDGYNE